MGLAKLLQQNHAYNTAACRGTNWEIFFPSDTDGCLEAKKICFTCPIQERCLEEHMLEEAGVWGGAGETERRHLSRGRPIAAQKASLVSMLNEWTTTVEMTSLPGFTDWSRDDLEELAQSVAKTRLIRRERPGRGRPVTQYRRRQNT